MATRKETILKRVAYRQGRGYGMSARLATKPDTLGLLGGRASHLGIWRAGVFRAYAVSRPTTERNFFRVSSGQLWLSWSRIPISAKGNL